MLTVTEDARQELKKLLVEHTSDPDIGVRLALESTGKLGLMLDKQTETDQVIEHEESKVLLLAQEISTRVDGYTLDVQEDAEGRRLFLSKE